MVTGEMVTGEMVTGGMVTGAASAGKPAVVICVENLPPRRDRRVWREACALRDAGIDTVVIGQRAPGDGDIDQQRVDDIHLLSYRAPREGHSAVTFAWEYLVSFVRTTRALRRARRDHDVRAVQVCNPPDIFFPLGWWLHLHRISFVFDHHDLVPELFETRYGTRARWMGRVLRWFERATLRTADHVIATNESYRGIEQRRGGVDERQITVVRNGPDTSTMYPRPPQPERREGREHLAVWFGNLGKQDGVDQALLAIAELVRRGRRDTHFAFCGRGEMLEPMRAMADELGIADWTTFTGWVTDDDAFAYLSTATIGLSADPPGPLNNVSTMNKTMEYMAFGLPVVAFDLLETRVSAGDAALYADDVSSFADAIEQLLDDSELRGRLGEIGLQRVRDHLAWDKQSEAYVDVYRALLDIDTAAMPPDSAREREAAHA